MSTVMHLMEKAMTMPNVESLAYLEKARTQTKNVAIGTAIAACVALVALVALAIFFPLAGLPFLIGGAIAAASVLALGITAVVYSERSVQINELFAFTKKTAEEKNKDLH